MEIVLALTLGSRCLECDCGDWSVEEWMWDMFFQVWLDGTLGRLYGMPMKPWARPPMPSTMRNDFRNRMGARKQEASGASPTASRSGGFRASGRGGMNDVYDVARYRLMTAAFNWQRCNLRLTAWSGTPVFDPTDETAR